MKGISATPSVERVIIPDSTILINYMLVKITSLIASLKYILKICLSI